ncbi:MAG: LPXTG cell wall anchor domain-containing protein [Deltaproteobacteria bacterium]|nr:LPXTG cell wall anchor domain-containing protein [Deltaproteobacteria bacterium]
MKELYFLIGLALLGLGMLVYFRRKESHLLKKKVRDSLSPALKKEIEKEREETLEKKKKFDEVMKKVKG